MIGRYGVEMQEPICGQPWLDKHRHDHTQAEIDALGIEVTVNSKLQGRVRSGDKKSRGIVKEIIKANKERRKGNG